MNIAPTGNNALAQSVSDLGELLKQTTSAVMGLETKMMKASVVERVQNPALGNGIDFSA
jgi:DNA-binding MarR family transcriptional regulator